MTIDLNCDIGEAYGSYKCQTICRHSDTARAVEIAAEGPVCLMCYERAPETCHRAIVAGRLAEMLGTGIRHLEPDLG